MNQTDSDIREKLGFYFITDDNAGSFSPVDQAAAALHAGAGIVQYRNKSFTLDRFEEVVAVQRLCKKHHALFIVNDNVLLAKATGADGIHIGQEDGLPEVARSIMGPSAIVGLSVSSLQELEQSNLGPCDYIGSGPVFATDTKKDAKAVSGLAGLKTIVKASPLPVVAIGGIGPENADACFKAGAIGVAVISCISRSEDPEKRALELARVIGRQC